MFPASVESFRNLSWESQLLQILFPAFVESFRDLSWESEIGGIIPDWIY